MTGALAGRTALITGASQGLGLEIARSYLREGARIVICARSEETLRAAEDELAGLGEVHGRPADVASPEEVEGLVAFAVERLGGLDVLVNNAGVYGPKGAIDDVDWAAWAKAIEINLMGSVLPARFALPHLRAAERGKVVQLSGGGATNPLPFLSAYAASKAAVVRFVETLAGEVADDGIDVNAIAPGALNTRMLDEVLEAGPEAVGEAFYAKALQQRDSGGTSLERGAALSVYLGSRKSDGITGRLLSAVWDPWEDLERHTDELDGTDIYTLRRIIPAERGQEWGERE
ncbi:SDR family oxidoreductase [Baekduia sp.]|jgi:3-oxoacyl-[acyl-carrier protein] reductase|uniref:SDR family NAD(P)-dependent oxidoreductase n=1 Tax=Baekduia sp. TaxID=2600305 RepID=UPI002DF79BC2|nr:SDR family oxidoreductase [Baekduia sp.]